MKQEAVRACVFVYALCFQLLLVFRLIFLFGSTPQERRRTVEYEQQLRQQTELLKVRAEVKHAHTNICFNSPPHVCFCIGRGKSKARA